jgi:2-dehydropantoate 2-reductase
MKIAVLGVGGIGSTFAFHLAQAGHEVTAIARGKRLEQLERDRAIVRVDGARAPVSVKGALDAETPYDLVLVTVLVSRVDAVLPALTESAAAKVMFMFNTFERLDRLREAVGASRFTFGFPAILASLDDGRLASEIVTRGMVTTVTEEHWAKVFTAAGIVAVAHADMESWLRTHAVFVVPAMIAGVHAHARRAGIPWSEAMALARAMDEGFGVVRALGNSITPSPMGLVSAMPIAMKAWMLWALSRTAMLQKTGAAGPGEPRTLIDAISAAAPGKTPALLAVRP